MDTLLIRKLKIFSANEGHVILSRVTTLEIKVFGKFKMYDGLYNCLLCVVIKIFFKVHHIFKRNFFMTKIKWRCSKRLKLDHINLDMEK
jgi:hypothetical protein